MSRYTNPDAAGYLLEAEACGVVSKELTRLIEKFQRKVKREAETRQAELEAALGYESETAIQDAYGWGFITERQYDRYRELYRQGADAMENHAPTRTELALNILVRINKDLRKDQDEWELSAMTPEQQTAELFRRAQAQNEWHEKLKSLKDGMRAVEGSA